MPKVAISADFLTAFSNIPQAQQKKVREFVTRFQNNPTLRSINYEPIHDMRDSRVRTVRIGLDYRAIVLHPEKGDVYLLAWIDHHDEAMAWAKHKRFQVNPVTGALQVFDTKVLEETEIETQPEIDKPIDAYALFETFSDSDLLKTGLPSLLLPTIRALRSTKELDKLEPHLPEEVYEALYYVANLGYSIDQAITESGTKITTKPIDVNDLETSLANANSKRRYTIIQNKSELDDTLDQPLAKWRIFLHPSQYNLVHRHFNGPARVLGGAGTGKTVVAMHRAKHLAANVFNQSSDRILFTTFTRNLARNIHENLQHLCGEEIERIEVINLHSWAVSFLRKHGLSVSIASDDEIDSCWDQAIKTLPSTTWDESFFTNEWEQVVKAQGISTKAAYLRVRRQGQGTSLSRTQRAVVWQVFAAFKRNLENLGKLEWSDVITKARLLIEQQNIQLPYRAAIVDETQDLVAEELRLLRQIVPKDANDLFFVGDAHQRIYGRPVVMSHSGINIRGRSRKLRINYRTTNEIRNWSMSVLKNQNIDDLDGGQDSISDTISLRNGIQPIIRHFTAFSDEVKFVVERVTDLVTGDSLQRDVCLVARTKRILERYMDAFDNAGISYLYLDKNARENSGTGVRLATMHRVKGLEFRHMFLTSINDGIIPFRYHDGSSLDAEEILQERCLLHVAATRARDTLTITSYGRTSPFLTIQ